MNVSSIQQKIERKRAEIQQLEETLAQAQQEPSEQQLARELHELLCHWNHTDGCGWYYEVSGGVDNWSGQAHREWLRRAQLISLRCQDKGVSVQDAIELYTLLQNAK